MLLMIAIHVYFFNAFIFFPFDYESNENKENCTTIHLPSLFEIRFGDDLTRVPTKGNGTMVL